MADREQVELGRDQSGTTVRLEVGEELAVRLPENRTTGYRWETVASDDAVVAPGGDDYEVAGTGHGGGGSHRFRFRAVGAGRATVALALRRPWETAAADRFEVAVEVTPAAP